MVRRRGVARTSVLRRRTYRTRVKWDPKIAARRFKLLLPFIFPELDWELIVLMQLEELVYNELTTRGIPTDLWEYYMAFSKRLWERRVAFDLATFQLEKTSLLNEFTLRGLDLPTLQACQTHAEAMALLKLGVVFEKAGWSYDWSMHAIYTFEPQGWTGGAYDWRV